MSAFIAFGGTGWLITAGAREPWIDEGIAQAGQEWPEEGERCQEMRSIRLQRVAGGWFLITLTEVAGADHLVREVRQLADRGGRSLRHAVYDRLESAGAHEEWRPCASRFLGFAEGGKHHAA